MSAPRAALIALASLAVLACSREPATPARPDVVLIVLDTLRADRLGCYGAPAEASPRIDEFARGADRYEACVAPAPWTLPSHASLFTGLFPFEHGSHGFRVEEVIDNAYPLHPSHATLAEELRSIGYGTAAFSANAAYLAPRHGLDQGFDRYHVELAPARRVFDTALAHVDARAKDDAPLFLFVNVMDVHRPYRSFDDETLAALPEDARPGPLLEALCRRVLGEGLEPGPLGAEVSRLYDLAVTRLDAEVGRFLDELERRGIGRDATIVITSDHGEAFGEHGLVEHAKDVYLPLVAVPLIVRGPGARAGRVVPDVASLVDVPGLIVETMGESARGALSGTFPRLPGAHPVVSEIHWARPRDIALYTRTFQHERVALREGSLELIVGGEGGPELYDLATDPQELRNLAGDDPARVRALRARLDAFLAERPWRGERLAPRPIDGEYARQMRALGYFDSGTSAGGK